MQSQHKSVFYMGLIIPKGLVNCKQAASDSSLKEKMIMDEFEEDLSNLSYSCPNITEEQIDFLYFTNWFLNGILQLIICLPGTDVLLEN